MRTERSAIITASYSNLIELSGFSVQVYASAGTETRARDIAARCERAYRFLSSTLDADAAVRVLVLAPEHWLHYTDFPIYGMPHYIDIQTLVVAGQNNDFWQNIAPPIEALPVQTAQAMQAVYGGSGSIDLSLFFDMLPVHEMAHLFHRQAGLDFPRLWLMEFFCNFCLHSYIAAVEPERLPELELFPQVMIAGGHERFTYHTLADLERLYFNVGPDNYGWYQSQLHAAAKRVYEAGGVRALQDLWQTFLRSNDVLTDSQLAARLRDEVHPELARVLTEWPS
jgi:hypothetical protein